MGANKPAVGGDRHPNAESVTAAAFTGGNFGNNLFLSAVKETRGSEADAGCEGDGRREKKKISLCLKRGAANRCFTPAHTFAAAVSLCATLVPLCVSALSHVNQITASVAFVSLIDAVGISCKHSMHESE